MSQPSSPRVRNDKNAARQKRYRENKKKEHEAEIADLRQEIENLNKQLAVLKRARDYWSPEESASWRIRALTAEHELEEIKTVLKILRGNNSARSRFFRLVPLWGVSNGGNDTSRDGVRDDKITVYAANQWDAYESPASSGQTSPGDGQTDDDSENPKAQEK